MCKRMAEKFLKDLVKKSNFSNRMVLRKISNDLFSLLKQTNQLTKSVRIRGITRNRIRV